MSQLHKRFSTDHVKLVLDWYESGSLGLEDAMARLEVKRRQFFDLLARYRKNRAGFTIDYARSKANHRVAPEVDRAIREELISEGQLIRDPAIPIRYYNYSAIRDSVAMTTGTKISVPTVINRAKEWGYYLSPPKTKEPHTREVLTEAVGMLLQHDASHHLWSPFADRKWSLITTLDDHSRKLLYGQLEEDETTWAHIQAAETVTLKYGVGLAFYTDNHGIFRFVRNRDSIWVKQLKGTDDVVTQWKQCIEAAGMQVWYALSPEAKGKIERPYRWLQDRIVRRCARGGVKRIEEAREILAGELERYNYRQVHSTTGETPQVRFDRAVKEGRTAFRPLKLKEPITSTKDIFCLRETRRVDGYRRVSWQKHILTMPRSIPVGAKVELHVIPERPAPEVRVWYNHALRQVYRLNV